MANQTISYLWRDPHAARGLPDRRFPAQSHQPIHGDAGFSGQRRQSIPADSAADVAARAALGDSSMVCGSTTQRAIGRHP